LEGVAVNVTELPEHTLLELAEILTVGGLVVFTVMVTVLEVAVGVEAQVLEEVITQ
jgi:hypothetical protein